MSDFTGKNLYISFAGTVIDTDYRSFNTSEEIGLVDASAGSDTARTYITTLEDGTAELNTLAQTGDTGATDIPTLCGIGTSGSLIWGPEGNTTGMIKYTVNAIVQSIASPHTYDGLVEYNVSFQFSGAVTKSTF